MDINQTGLRCCASYALPPNLLHFCGPDKQNDLLAYLKLGKTNQGLVEIINQFETLYPYLLLIASENGIDNAFDSRVVEAYWLGNDLLKKVKPRVFTRHLTDKLILRKKLTVSNLSDLLNKLDTGLPCHNFHVFNVFTRTGHHAQPHTLETMDNCRISWGKIVHSSQFTVHSFKKYEKFNKKQLFVETRPLVCNNDRLELGKPVVREVNAGFVDCQIGDWVSLHWGWVCEKLTMQKLANLRYYTQKAIELANVQGNM